jgi:hypothetical protein
MTRRTLLLAASGVSLVCVFLMGLGEVTIRLVHLLRDGIPLLESPFGRVGPIVLDPRLGWRATDWYAQDLTEQTSGGVVYAVHRSQSWRGFRQYGNVRSKNPKLLVIGDSFTQATAVSDQQTYHALLKRELGMEVFAYGAGGYGTLQKYLILDEVFDAVQPTVLLWQFCTNDFINNDHALEVASTVNNNGWVRPYWEHGQIVLRSPKPSGVQTREWINRHSRFLYFIVSRLDRLRARAARETVERAIERDGASHPGFARAVQTTDDLMGKVRARVGTIPIHAFSCEKDEPYNSALARIAQHHQIDYWADVPEAVGEALSGRGRVGVRWALERARTCAHCQSSRHSYGSLHCRAGDAIKA